MSEKVLEWKNLYYEKLNSDKKIKTKYARTVDGLSGKASSGKITAIMGSSGAGKTNLFELLVGKIETSSKTSGIVLYDGKEREIETWIKSISYLEQDDIYFPELTIYDSMFYSLKFLYPDAKANFIDGRIEKALIDAEILNKKFALIDSLSGGERKRAMIALKLIGDPKVLILDEPTTGLDSHNALCIVNNLKRVAVERNIIVILTVHQPGEALFNLFDTLIYITKRGALYEGPIEKIDEFLRSYGITKMEKISVSEFLFELFSENPYPYEIKDFQPQAKEIIRINREKDEEARRNLKFSFKGNSYVNLKEISFGHMCTLIRRRILLLTKSVQFYLFFVSYFFIIGLQIYLTKKEVNAISSTKDDMEDAVSEYFSDETFLETFLRISYVFKQGVSQSFMFVFILMFKFSHNLDICKQEILTGRYSVRTYFITMILFELFSFVFTSLCLLIPFMFVLNDMKTFLCAFIIDIIYVLVTYFSYLPGISFFVKDSGLYTVTYFQYLLSIQSPLSLKKSSQELTEVWKGFKYAFWVFNVIPNFILNLLIEYFFQKIFLQKLMNCRKTKEGALDMNEAEFDDKKYIENYDWLGLSFSPKYLIIWIIFFLSLLISVSLIFTKWKISSNIRLKLN